MPIVRIVYQKRLETALKEIRSDLQKVVAQALSTSNGKLTENDIELIFELGNSLNTGKDLKIIVFANNFQERRHTIQKRSEQISEKLNALLISKNQTTEGFVYVRLSEGGLGSL